MSKIKKVKIEHPHALKGMTIDSYQTNKTARIELLLG